MKISRLHIPGLILLLACLSCDENPVTPGQEYDDLKILLNTAYSDSSQAMLDVFFEAWRDTLPALTQNEIQALPDTSKLAYNIFYEFYTPANLRRLTGGTHENFETDFRYIVVQNNISITVVDTLPQYYYYEDVIVSTKTIDDFRPVIKSQGFPAVYLSTEMDSLIKDFLLEPGDDYEEEYRRVEFLRKAMQLTHHHWIRDYHKGTMPVASAIYINDTFDKAMVSFRVFYQFGSALFELHENDWVLTHSELSAIE